MQISEIRIKLINRRKDRLKAFCSVTFDNEFVVRDLKVIEGPNGFFVAMPSRKLTDHCPSCGAKNYVRSRYCSECGMQLDENRHNRHRLPGRVKLHADIAHPINAKCREMIQDNVIDAYHRELELSKQPGYKAPVMDFDDYDSYYRDYKSRRSSHSSYHSHGSHAHSDRKEDSNRQVPHRDTEPPKIPDQETHLDNTNGHTEKLQDNASDIAGNSANTGSDISTNTNNADDTDITKNDTNSPGDS